MTRRELPGRSVAAGLGGRGNLPADSTLNAAARTKQIHVTPVVRHIDIKNVNSQKSKHAIFIDGYKNSPRGRRDCFRRPFSELGEGTHSENVDAVLMYDVTVNGKQMEEHQ